MKTLFAKYKTIILYLIFGGLTTVINLAAFYVLRRMFSFEATVPANVSAWFISVVFAFLTNKYFVFEADKKSQNSGVFQLLSFFAARLFSGILDWLIVFLLVDLLNYPDMPVKIASNIIVIVLNYVASKLVIFK